MVLSNIFLLTLSVVLPKIYAVPQVGNCIQNIISVDHAGLVLQVQEDR